MPRLESCAWSCSCTARGRHRSQLGDTAAGLAAKVGEMLSSSVSSPSLALVGRGARSPSTSSASSTASSTSSTLNWSQHLVQRSVVLFVVGAFMALVLNLLQIQRNVTLFPDEVISTLFSSAWWVPPCCGTAAGESLTSTSDFRFFLILSWRRRGGGAECVTRARGNPHFHPTASVASSGFWEGASPAYLKRTVLNIFFQKLDFANNIQLSLTLAALSLGLWWTFDRSRSGLGLGITIAFVATLITQFLVYNGVYQYTSPDFLYIRSWLPCIFFSGGVTVGNIGRQLAMVI
ncbi:INSI1 protein, partial [Loxia curvirostra]|nr:INSI1 protein [Loxia curvirostra]NXG96605.1 INSI1 protein [Loxia leucoptera]